MNCDLSKSIEVALFLVPDFGCRCSLDRRVTLLGQHHTGDHATAARASLPCFAESKKHLPCFACFASRSLVFLHSHCAVHKVWFIHTGRKNLFIQVLSAAYSYFRFVDQIVWHQDLKLENVMVDCSEALAGKSKSMLWPQFWWPYFWAQNL